MFVANAAGNNGPKAGTIGSPTGVEAAEAALCLPGSLSAAAVDGKAVLCTRAELPGREEHGRPRRRGVGLVLANTQPEENIATDIHWVPAVHVSAADGAAIRALLADGSTASLWLEGGHGIEAPGVGILAADTPTRVTGARPAAMFKIASGTSMAWPEPARRRSTSNSTPTGRRRPSDRPS